MVAVMLPMAQQLSNRRISYGTAKNPSLRLDGKTALVTGPLLVLASACAVALAEAGAEVTAAAVLKISWTHLLKLPRKRAEDAGLCSGCF